VTLLDRRIVDKLFQTVFTRDSKPPILQSDWPENAEYKKSGAYPSENVISPFDYLYYNAESALYRWCEEFVIDYVWRPSYSSTIIGKNDRPPMVAVAMDMIELVEYLARVDERVEPRFLAELFKDFLKSRQHQLRSIIFGSTFDFDWACQGYIWDLYNIIILKEVSKNGMDQYNPKSCPHYVPDFDVIPATLVERVRFPGGESIKIGIAPIDANKVKDLYGSLGDMKASFIKSGPFDFALTPIPGEHLMMKNRKIHVFCEDGTPKTGNPHLVPGVGYFGLYMRHKLGKYAKLLRHLIRRQLGVDAVLVRDLIYSYSVIFSRDPESRAIADNLFLTGRKLKVKWDVSIRNVKIRGCKKDEIIIPTWSELGKVDPTLSAFQRYRGHFALLQEHMEKWKPESYRDVLQPGYRDRFTWYATAIGAFVAVLGFITIVTSIISTATGIISMKAALAANEK
jgi:hypothetical protein